MNNTHMVKFNKVAFSTGGIKGISYIGCIKALEDRNILNNVKYFAGSSIGALVALLLSIGYKSDEIFNTLKKVNLQSLREIKITNILETFGISDTNRLGSLVKLCLMEKGLSPKITFLQLNEIRKNTLIITGTNLNSRESHYFNYITTPNMEIVSALKISMCIPFFFNAVKLNDNIYVDGGLMDPLPSNYLKNFNEKYELEDEDGKDNYVLAVNINNNLIKSCSKIDDLELFTMSVTACILSKMNSLMNQINIHSNIKQINLDTNNFSAIDFNITENDILKLVDLGYEQTKKFLDQISEKEELETINSEKIESETINSEEIESETIDSKKEGKNEEYDNTLQKS